MYIWTKGSSTKPSADAQASACRTASSQNRGRIDSRSSGDSSLSAGAKGLLVQERHMRAAYSSGVWLSLKQPGSVETCTVDGPSTKVSRGSLSLQLATGHATCSRSTSNRLKPWAEQPSVGSDGISGVSGRSVCYVQG